jgi:hypothetical protein
MRRLIAMLVFILGGISCELINPVNCSTIYTRQSSVQKRRTP